MGRLSIRIPTVLFCVPRFAFALLFCSLAFGPSIPAAGQSADLLTNPPTGESSRDRQQAIITPIGLPSGFFASQAPLKRHCFDSGPLPLNDPEFCGCTWGHVYYNGQPVTGAEVVLTVGTETVDHTSVLNQDIEETPFYSLSGANIGAERGDLMTLSVALAGETISRTIKAIPDEEGQQFVNLVIPQMGEWVPWISGGYTRTLAIDNIGSELADGADSMIAWASGADGLVSIDLIDDSVTEHSLPWDAATVGDIDFTADGMVWATGVHDLAKFDGNQWLDFDVPFTDSIRASAIDPTTGQVWVGGGDSTGQLARLDGVEWQMTNRIAAPITDLSFDSTGKLWVSTWGRGVYRRGVEAGIDDGWTNFTLTDGLASDRILAMAVQSDDLWFGAAQPYLDSRRQQYVGGLSHFDASAEIWTVYTSTHGLPSVTIEANISVAAPIHGLAVDSEGLLLLATDLGLYRQIAAGQWLPEILGAGGAIELVARQAQSSVAVGSDGSFYRWQAGRGSSRPPVVEWAADNPVEASVGDPVTLSAVLSSQFRSDSIANSAYEYPVQEDDPILDNIAAWAWTLADNPICTTVNACTIEAEELTMGQNLVQLQVQDTRGNWSSIITTEIDVIEQATGTRSETTLLPFVVP